ncbi:MAG: tRNA (adenosine(37)-N6)-threonylcarbamoyltransferase complex ATPase subunit type 1 TsaE [Acidimicrobiales bacterium]
MGSTTTLLAATDGAEATRLLAGALANLLVDGDLIVLTGDLGAGKTCLVQGLGPALGVDDRITSPTFTLVATYDGSVRLNHLDVYRLDGPSETMDLDLPDLLEDGVTVIEWGERIDAVLPDERLVIELTFGDGDDDRNLRFGLFGQRWVDRRSSLADVIGPWTAAEAGGVDRAC